MGEPGQKIADPRYMLDFKGVTTEISEETMKEAVSSMDFKDAQSRIGSLPQEIEKWAERNMIDISDRGLGGDRWHIGIPFNSPLIALHFMIAAEQQFKEALEKGWLVMHLITWARRKEGDANDQGPKEGADAGK